MLKCPRCGARVKGPDLLTGICSACQERLSDSISWQADQERDVDETFASEEESGSGPEGSSLVEDSDSSVTRGGDGILSGSFGGSYDLGLTPAAGADGLKDHDTADSIGSGDASGDDVGQTYVSDEMADESASGTYDSHDSVEETDANRTFVSDEIEPGDEEPDDAEAQMRTLVGVEEDDQDPEAQMRTIGADFDAEGALRTLVGDAAFGNDEDDDGGDKTFAFDGSADATDAGRTIVGEGDSFGADGNDRTFVSDNVPEALVRTLQTNFGDDDEPPTRTIKGKEPKAPKGQKAPKSSLVIKTKTLRDVQATEAKAGQDPEYELLKVLGEGGMGIVYNARQTSIDRNVALKMIKGAAAKNDKQQAKFLAEAVVTGDLDHPNIVPIYDVGRNDAGALFYSMKMVQGTPWDKAIGQKSLTENLDILMRVADAVAFAHARGVVHRDLKPENTMLGGYGEVLVMDWGLAHPSKDFRKAASITETSSMGGTPAYMAPEMATGPLEKITHLADVYLLGAMLYEILTGKPPHTGKNAMKCLMAAARNEITPTEKTGELIDIALKAMATDPAERFQSVQALQAAIRDYQSHSESILLSTRAEDDLAEAQKSDEYQAYSKALFGFEEAFELWDGNHRAKTGVRTAQLAYANCAQRKGDFDLGLSLLDDAFDDHRALKTQLLAAKQEREARKSRLAALRKMAAGLAVAVFATVTVAFFWISYEADKARKAEKVAQSQKAAAIEARSKAEEAQKLEAAAKIEAVASRDLAEEKRKEAVEAQKLEAQAKLEAVAARDLAEEKRKEAEEARKLEEIAKRKEEYEAYIAQIGLAAAKIDENAFESARVLLEGCRPELRNWEWGRLMHLCSQSMRSINAKAPLDAMALSPVDNRCASGGWDGTARIWDLESGGLLQELRHGGLYVHSVAFSPDGRWLATGSDDPAGFVQLWDLQSSQRIAVLKGHDDAVLSVAFSHDGRRLVTSSYDKTARVWDLEERREIRVLKGHTWWVWQATFSPDDHRIATASQDGTALVWNVETGEHSPAFTGHSGPVYCVAFADEGRSVVTGGYDRRLLVWNPETLKPYVFRNLEQGASVKTAPEYRELGGHSTSIRCLNVSSDGRLLLSGSQDNTLRLWDFTTGGVIQTFRGHDSWIRGIAFGRDGRTLVSASQDATIRTWSIAGYAELRSIQGRELDGHADAVLAAAFSPDQKLVVTASRDRTARTWDAATGSTQQTFTEGHSFLASSARFYDHGRKLVTAAVDNTARLWDVATGTESARLDRSGRAAAVAVSQDDRWIATGGDARQAQLWDAATGKRVRTFEGHQSEVTAVAFSPDGTLLFTGDAKGHGRLWRVETGEVLHKLEGHTRRISAATFTPDGRRVLTASSDKTVSQWDVASGREVRDEIIKHPDSVLSIALSPDGTRVVTCCVDRNVRVWDLASRTLERTFGPFPEIIHSVSISSDGNRLLTVQSEERTVRQWDLVTGQEQQIPQADNGLGPVLDLKRSGGLVWAAVFAPADEILTVGGSDARLWDLKTGRERITFSPHATVASVSFSPDGRWIVTGSWDNSAKIWDAAKGTAVLKLIGEHQGFVNSAQFSPNGRQVLTASDDGTAKLWEWTLPAANAGEAVKEPTAKVIRTFEGHADRVRFAAFSDDGKFIVTTSDDKTARLWNAETGEMLHPFVGHQWAVLAAAFSKDGKRLITGSEDNLAKVWNVESGACELTLAGHTAPVASVAFAPDSARVLSGSRDQVAKLWDAKTGKEILTLNRHTDDVTSVSFSPDGRQILTGSRDGTAVIWLTTDWTDRPAPANVARLPQP